MPLTPKGKEILANMEQQYGAKKGKSVFYASANKGTIKGVHHSPDRYEGDAVSNVEPPRVEYHGTPENLNTSQSPKRAGQSRGKIQELDGTGNLGATTKSKSAAMPDTPAGGDTQWADNVDSYNDTGELP